ncbi:MAG: hypothetical protein WD468_05555 [Pirellulales bacterium]
MTSINAAAIFLPPHRAAKRRERAAPQRRLQQSARDERIRGLSFERLEDRHLLAMLTVFVSPITIAANDAAYEGHDIRVDGTTVTINGAHSFNSLEAINGAVVSHSVATTQAEYRLDLFVSGNVTIASGSKIDVSGKGYLPGRTLGNSTIGGASGGYGASYGGVGGVSRWDGNANSPYGDYANPNDLGSGGGEPGGGLVRLTVGGVLQLDGSLRADSPNGGFGGSSGGGVYVRVPTLRGSGAITANGGYGRWDFGSGSTWGGGGGGRIAIYANDYSGFDLGRITATGGSGHWEGNSGGAGTIYIRDLDDLTDLLVVDTSAGGLTPITISAAGKPRSILLRPGGQNATILSLTGMEYAERTELIVGAGASLTVVGQGIWSQLVIDGATVTMDGRQELEWLSILHGGLLTHAAATETETHRLELNISGDVVIDATSRIDVSGKGYLPGRTLGNSIIGGASGGYGASYGGVGGVSRWDGNANSPYGDYANPNDLGSGGGEPGGGLVRLTVGGVLQLDGSLRADSPNGGFGGSSGGGVYVRVPTLRGSGAITANGGYGRWDFGSGSTWGGGGGGRIAIYANDYSGFDLGRITATGGSGHWEGNSGGAGTIYIGDASPLLFSPATRQTARLTPMTFDGPSYDVTIELDFVARNQSIELLVGATTSNWQSVGSFTNSSGASPWVFTANISAANVDRAEYVAVTSTAALSIRSAVGRYPNLALLEGYQQINALVTDPVDLITDAYYGIAELHLWNWGMQRYQPLIETEWSNLLDGKQNIFLTHGWNDKLDVSGIACGDHEYMVDFARNFITDRTTEELGQFNIIAVDWYAEGSPLGSDPNNLLPDVFPIDAINFIDANLSAANGLAAGRALGERLLTFAASAIEPGNLMLIGHSNGTGFMAALAGVFATRIGAKVDELVALDAPWGTVSYLATRAAAGSVNRLSNYYLPLVQPSSEAQPWEFDPLLDYQLGFGAPMFFADNVTNFELDRDISTSFCPGAIAHSRVPLRYATTADDTPTLFSLGFSGLAFCDRSRTSAVGLDLARDRRRGPFRAAAHSLGTRRCIASIADRRQSDSSQPHRGNDTVGLGLNGVGSAGCRASIKGSQFVSPAAIRRYRFSIAADSRQGKQPRAGVDRSTDSR